MLNLSADMALLLVAGILAIPALVVCVQLFLSCLPPSNRKRIQSDGAAGRQKLAVLIPAHNEEAGIRGTIRNIRGQLADGDRLIVVADNCTDRTEQLARQAGAEVVVRQDATRVGKGYALQAGYDYLRNGAGARALIVFVDADCTLTPGTLDNLSRAASDGRPVQALDLMQSHDSASSHARLSEFAWLVRNHARPAGYARLGLGCHLMGTGMAIPGKLLDTMRLGTAHIVEDNVLGAELTLRGHAPKFCEDACVISEFPKTQAGRVAQRSRWIHGYLQVMGRYAAPLILRGMKRRDPDAFCLGLDLLVPPLAVLISANLMIAGVSAAWFVSSGSIVPMLISAVASILLCLALTAVWLTRARPILPLRDLIHLPSFFRMTLGIAAGFFLTRRSGWTRSDRS